MATMREPRYQQIAIRVAERIVQNELKVGQKISARSTLATTFGVSAETARKAINVLSDLGIVEAIHGSGVVVVSRQKAQKYLAQYREVQSIQDLQGDILAGVARQRAELTSFAETLETLVDQTRQFQLSNPLLPYEMELTAASENLGKTVSEINLWQNTGATLVGILHDDDLIVSPGPYATLYQGDTIYFVGDAHTQQVVQNFFYTD
jgi:K+/H+ antiporter YhaU regulatory subunit KhtT